MKQRFSFLDIRAVTNELSEVLAGSYVKNVYSEKRRFIIKFNTMSLLIEPGIRIHAVEEYAHDLNHFAKAMRVLRRHKVCSIQQCGFDRVVQIDFGERRLYAEFFSSGNIILTDNSCIITHLLRTIPGIYEKGQSYVVNNAELGLNISLFCSSPLKKFLPLDKLILEDIKRRLEEVLGVDIETFKREIAQRTAQNDAEVLEMLQNIKVSNPPKSRDKSDADREKEDAVLHRFPSTVDKKEADQRAISSNAPKNSLIKRISTFSKFMEDLIRELECVKNFGVIVLENGEPKNVLPMKILSCSKVRTFSSFNDACKHYFVDKVKQEPQKGAVVEEKQRKRMEDLEQNAAECKKKAELIESSLLVPKILEVFEAVRKNKISWKDFFEFKVREDSAKNEVSLAIKSVDFKKGVANVVLAECEVEIEIDSSVHQNASKYYQKVKLCKEKIEKTAKALKKIVKKVGPKTEVVKVEKRKPYWFEKFHFVLLPGKIVLSGKNAQQNEILVKKFLTNLYFHCSVTGGSSVILEKFNGEIDLSFHDAPEKPEKPREMPDEIMVAGEVALCMSKCWNEKVPYPVFYVGADQVSKSAPTGQYLTKGSFVIRGKKNEVDAYKLEYGVGIVFRVEMPKIVILEKENIGQEDMDTRAERLFFSVDGAGKKIMHAMAVAGPWSLIRHFKYKAKLVYGNIKKGKLVKELQMIFSKKSNALEKDFIRKIHPDEYMNVLMPNVRLGKF